MVVPTDAADFFHLCSNAWYGSGWIWSRGSVSQAFNLIAVRRFTAKQLVVHRV